MLGSKVGNRALLCNDRVLCTMPNNFGQCKNDHFITQFFHKFFRTNQPGHCMRFPRQSVPCPDSRGQSELNTAVRCTHLYGMVFVSKTTALFLYILFV